jgi:hypothetical protein
VLYPLTRAVLYHVDHNHGPHRLPCVGIPNTLCEHHHMQQYDPDTREADHMDWPLGPILVVDIGLVAP